MNLEVRTLTPDDWATWRSMRLAALADAPEAFGSRFEDWVDADEGRWRARLSLPGAVDLLAYDTAAGEPVGMATGTPVADGEGAQLISMWVAPSARGYGVAALLIDAVARWASDAGAPTLQLSVMRDNDAARRAYEKNGFVAVAETDATGESDEREMVMRRAL